MIGLYSSGMLLAEFSMDEQIEAIEACKFATEETGIFHELKIVEGYTGSQDDYKVIRPGDIVDYIEDGNDVAWNGSFFGAKVDHIREHSFGKFAVLIKDNLSLVVPLKDCKHSENNEHEENDNED